jgi:hypothetical protein
MVNEGVGGYLHLRISHLNIAVWCIYSLLKFPGHSVLCRRHSSATQTLRHRISVDRPPLSVQCRLGLAAAELLHVIFSAAMAEVPSHFGYYVIA